MRTDGRVKMGGVGRDQPLPSGGIYFIQLSWYYLKKFTHVSGHIDPGTGRR
jgi:hypothetical protein